jgi:hypothetical protein
MPELRVLSMGWGRQTWTLAAMMALGELPRVDFIVHADTTHEREATYEFRRKWEPWLGEHGLKVVTVEANRPDVVREDWSDPTLIPAFTVDRDTGSEGQIRRQCTHDWKIMPIRRFIRAELERRGVKLTKGVVESWQGISFDENRRMRTSDVDYILNVYPLVDRRLRVGDCLLWLEARQLPLPPKSSCTFCPFRSLASWRELKRDGGSDWATAVSIDTAIRDKRPKVSLFVHPARRPLPEAVTIPEDFGASQGTLFGEADSCDSGYCFT